jgi:hypothetical protein
MTLYSTTRFIATSNSHLVNPPLHDHSAINFSQDVVFLIRLDDPRNRQRILRVG